MFSNTYFLTYAEPLAVLASWSYAYPHQANGYVFESNVENNGTVENINTHLMTAPDDSALNRFCVYYEGTISEHALYG